MIPITRPEIPSDFIRIAALPFINYDGREGTGEALFLQRPSDTVLPLENNNLRLSLRHGSYGGLIVLDLSPASADILANALTNNSRVMQRLFRPRAVVLTSSNGSVTRITGGDTFSLVDDRIIVRDASFNEIHNLAAEAYDISFERTESA